MTTNQPNATPEAIFHQARAMTSPEERAAYLARACAGDAALLARVEALLKAEAEAGSFLGTKDRAAATTREAAPLLERAGQTIGHYKLLQLIGEGGFGAVFMAQQDVPVRRRVALKIIKPGMDSRMVAARFEAERQALALMDHPHIARVFDGGVTDAAMGARPYFVMEYVKGDPITTFADAHQLSIEDRLTLFTQVCEAVQHAHTKGIIHRDLKPGNVLVSMTDGRPFAKVIDFGIAKATGAALTDKTLFTEHRQLIGTPEYMSPEQAEGSPDIDTRTDVYALGVLLYELLTGATPFDAARLRSAAFAEMQRIIKEEEPPAPSLRLSRDVNVLAATAAARKSEPAKLGPLVKGELDWIVMKALDKDRARRYETPSQLADDVRRHAAGEAVVAAPPSAAYRVRKFVRRNRGAVGAVSAVALALAAGGSVALWQWRDASRSNALLVEANESARQSLVDIVVETQDLDKLYPNMQAAIAEAGVTEAQFRAMNAEAYVAGLVAGSPSAGSGAGRPPRVEVSLLASQAVRRVKDTVALRRSLDATNNKLAAQTNSAIDALSEIVHGMHGTGQGSMAVSTPMPDGRQFTWVHTIDEAGKSRLVIVEGGLGTAGKALENPDHPLPPAPPDVAMSLLTTEIRATLAQLHAQTDAAEWSAYTANFILALQALDARDYAQARSYLDACAPRCRGFEWHWARLQASAVVLQLSSNGEPDTPALVSRDGRRVMLPCVRRGPDGSNTESAEVWNTTVWPPQKVSDLPISLRGGRSVSMSPDGTRAVIVTNDGAFLVREASPTEIVRLSERDGSALDAAFNPDGRSIAVATNSDSGSVVLWAVPDMKPVEQQRWVIGSAPEFVRFNADGSKLLVGGRQPAVWDLTAPRPEVITRIDASNFNIPDGMFTTDGSEVLLAGVEPAVATLWDIAGATPRRRVSMRGHGASVLSAVIQPQTGQVLTVSYDDSVRLWARSGQCLGSLRLDGPRVVDVDTCNVRAAFRADGRLAIVPRNNTVLFVDPDALTDTRASSPDIVLSVAEQAGDELRKGLVLTTPDGSRRIVGGADKTIRFYETKDGKPTLPATPESPEGVFREIAVFRMDGVATNLQMTSDGARLIIRLADGSARVWDIRDPEDRRKDLEAEQAERGPAAKYLEALLGGDLPDDKLRDAVVGDASLTPLRRLVAVELLDERLDEDRDAAAREFGVIVKDQTDPAVVRARAAAAELPARVKRSVVEMAARWKYRAPQVSDVEKLAAETRRRRLAEVEVDFNQFESARWDLDRSDPEVIRKTREALAVREEYLKSDDPLVIKTMDRLAWLEIGQDESRRLMESALAREGASGRPITWTTLQLWSSVVQKRVDGMDFEGACELLKRLGQSVLDVFDSYGKGSASWGGEVFELLGWLGNDRRHDLVPVAERVEALTAERVRLASVRRRLGDLRLNVVDRPGLGRDFYEREARDAEWLSRAAPELADVGTYSAVVAVRLNKYAQALAAITRAMELRAATPDDPATLVHENAASPIDLAILAMVRYRLSQEPGADPALALGAHEALREARAIVADPGNAETWAKDADAQALLKEAGVLIDPK